MNYIIKKILERLEGGIDEQDVQYFYFGDPKNLSKDQCMRGVLTVTPISQNIIPVTTGLTDQESDSLDIVLYKSMNTRAYKDANKETGAEFLNRVMSGQNDCGTLTENTVRYIVRRYMKDYGIRQPEINIEYDDEKSELQGVVTATMTVTVEDHTQQVI